MELRKLKELWDGSSNSSIPINEKELNQILNKRSRRPIAIIKRNLKLEMAFGILFYCFFIWIVSNQAVSIILYFDIILLVVAGILYSIYVFYKNQLLKKMECMSCEVKSNLSLQLGFLEKLVKLYFKVGNIFVLFICSIQSIAQTDKTNALLWEISGNSLKQPSYLFGTIHMICKEDFTFSELAKQKFNASKQVYLELDMDDPKLQPVMMGLMQLPGNESLRNKLGENNFNKLDSFLKKQTNMNLAVFDRFKPMMVMSLLAQRILSCAAMESYEMNFVKMASEQKKELLGLERVEDQVAVFDAIPDSLEIRSIMNMVNDFESQKKEFTRMSSLYKAQNLDSLYQLLVASPEMMGSQELLLDRRNRNWIPIMESAMKKSSTFFAVGAGHLAGSQGVLELLRKQGYKVKPIQ